MLALSNNPVNLMPEENFKQKIRCGEVYRNLNGNEMFQKFYYRCLECSMDFESSPEFEEHVIVHYLQEDEDCRVIDTTNETKDVIAISSDDENSDDDDDDAYALLHEAVEVTSLVEENISENDLPLPLMQMLSEQSPDSSEQMIKLNAESDDEEETNVAFSCEGLRRQALHQYSEPEKCCTQCPAYFTTKSDLNLHLHIHTLPNTVTCSHCYEVFTNTFELNGHIRVKRRKLYKVNRNKEDNSLPSNKVNKKNRNQNTANSTDLKTQNNEFQVNNSKKKNDNLETSTKQNKNNKNGKNFPANDSILFEKPEITSNTDTEANSISVG